MSNIGLTEETMREWPEEAIAMAEKGRRRKSFKRGERIYLAGEKPGSLHRVSRGLVGLTTSGPGGNEHLLRLFTPGEFHGYRALFANEEYHAGAIALEPTESDVFDRELILEIVSRFPQVGLDFLERLAKDLRRAEARMVSASDQDVASRVAGALIYLHELSPEHQWTRREIAEFCGSTTPTVIRCLARFEAEGWIRPSGRRILIESRQALLDLSQGEKD